jgi:hypothetical protein
MLTDINEIAYEIGKDGEDWFPDLCRNRFFMAAAAAGEVGELINVLKKVERGDCTIDEVTEQVDNEAVDAIIYLLAILDIDEQDVAALYAKIRENNVRRFGVPSTAEES